MTAVLFHGGKCKPCQKEYLSSYKILRYFSHQNAQPSSPIYLPIVVSNTGVEPVSPALRN